MLAALVALLLQWPVSGPCQDTDGGVPILHLGVGTQKVLSVREATSLRAFHSGVVDLKVLGKTQVLVIGAGYGNTRITIENDAGVQRWDVEVRRGGCDLHVSDLAKLFPCGSTLEERGVDDRVFLEGEASSAREWEVAMTVAKQHRYIVLTGHLDPQVIEQEFLEAGAALRAAGLLHARWVVTGDAVSLEGELSENAGPKLRALEAVWRPRLELVLSHP